MNTTTIEKPDIKTNTDNSFGKDVLRLRTLFGLTQKELGEILGTNERTVVRWERSQQYNLRPHLPGKTGIGALESLAELLSDIFEPDVIKVWVDRPNPALNNERPRDFAKKPGGVFRMVSLLDVLQR
jgi:DNA-binding XRE family transcriptional regulator